MLVYFSLYRSIKINIYFNNLLFAFKIKIINKFNTLSLIYHRSIHRSINQSTINQKIKSNNFNSLVYFSLYREYKKYRIFINNIQITYELFMNYS